MARSSTEAPGLDPRRADRLTLLGGLLPPHAAYAEAFADVPEPRNSVELVTMARHRLGRTVIELEDATLTVPTEPPRTIVDRQTWRIGPGDRIGIVGINGSGKTTLLRAIAGERPLDDGKRVQGTTVRLAHLSQDLSDLPLHRRVLQAVEDVAGIRGGRGGFWRRRAPRGVLVKAPKRGQDLRVDLPAIGPRTIAKAAKAGLAGIAVASGGTIVLNRAETVAAADRAGLFVCGMPVSGESA